MSSAINRCASEIPPYIFVVAVAADASTPVAPAAVINLTHLPTHHAAAALLLPVARQLSLSLSPSYYGLDQGVLIIGAKQGNHVSAGVPHIKFHSLSNLHDTLNRKDENRDCTFILLRYKPSQTWLTHSPGLRFIIVSIACYANVKIVHV